MVRFAVARVALHSPRMKRRADDPPVTHTVAEPAGGAASEPVRTLGRYRLEREVGSGGMGVVYAALDTDLGRRVAIKLLHPEPSAATRARLLREARAMARLTHPNVVTIFEVDTIADTDFVVMELVDGGSIENWLRDERPAAEAIVEAFVGAGRGLSAAHAVGMVHRDFKPHNVLRSRSGRVLVTDFSLARDCAELPPPEPHAGPLVSLTVSGAFVGTPAYMAPEQWRHDAISPSVDQFAFCVSLWEALAGKRPFHGETRDELRAALERGPDSLDASCVPRRLRPLLLRGLRLDPAERFASMDALVDQLAQLAAPRRKRPTTRRR